MVMLLESSEARRGSAGAWPGRVRKVVVIGTVGGAPKVANTGSSGPWALAKSAASCSAASLRTFQFCASTNTENRGERRIA